MIDRFRSLPMARSAFLAGRTPADLCRSVPALFYIIAIGLPVGFGFHNTLSACLAGVALDYPLWLRVHLGLRGSGPGGRGTTTESERQGHTVNRPRRRFGNCHAAGRIPLCLQQQQPRAEIREARPDFGDDGSLVSHPMISSLADRFSYEVVEDSGRHAVVRLSSGRDVTSAILPGGPGQSHPTTEQHT